MESIESTLKQRAKLFSIRFCVVNEEEYIGDELREKVIGMTADWRLLLVVYVMKEDGIRIISAREVTTVERALYETR